jgi:hypothetical protein
MILILQGYSSSSFSESDINLNNKKNNGSRQDPVCGSSDYIECSAYADIFNIRLEHPYYNDLFNSACAAHDYCYRFGAKTYGKTQKNCDDTMYNDMVDICNRNDTENLAKYIISGGFLYADCRATAVTYRAGLSALGSKHFKSGNDSKFCEYRKFCPPGKLDAKKYAKCKCLNKTKKKKIDGTVHCEGLIACPKSGLFRTTGKWRGCKCKGGKKIYRDKANYYAQCTTKCPSDKFNTVGKYRDCTCPKGSKKAYIGPTAGVNIAANSMAVCTTSCPSDTFMTTGKYKNCNCPKSSKKHYLDPAKARATCSKKCPSGKFSTTGKWRGCKCPNKRKKFYMGIGDSKATCQKACPTKKFKTTGKYRGCKCPKGKKKAYKGLFKSRAICVKK